MSPDEAKKQIFELDQNRAEYLKQYDQKIITIRKSCAHDWEFMPDPSGNNDSGYSCSGCGAWTKRIK